MAFVYGEARCFDEPAERANRTTSNVAPKALGFPGGFAADGGFAAGDLALAAGFDYRPAPGHVRRSLGPRHAVQDLARVVVRPGRGVSVRPHFSVADECPI